ncbi:MULTISPECIES: hypothetical protein [Pantoea]|uniref:Tail fiber protein n=1 Tax=Candidatus Pantoea gossypiicola TaxID=2608008 RepID=A0AB34CKY3_9GAMM|nr:MULTISPECIES: hypothetical protein [Pantoea]KAA5931557.1 hypothetical protein F3I59_05650 [Pantoea sp. VH_8]KAA5936692.1 hypothetical protein F3I58_05680 [Pantoea sp. VH_4]KAA5987963.1 hypothetical protein F3I49_05570 [Pantoea sp. M_4]KAA6126811.1 hypothetical protein F3I20_07050 [Pantoea gossypiicola]
MKPLIDPINTDDGQFHGRDNQTGQLATIVTPVYMNDTQGATRSLQREVISILTAAGIKPADATNDQLLNALKSLFLAEDDSRVSGALQKDKNLSDLIDSAKAREALSLDKVGNWVAVQQGGGTGMLTNKVYAGWNGKKLIAQVDSSPMGALFYEKNPPTAADCNAFPAEGGTVGSKGVTTPFLFANGHGAPLNQQGTWIEWNETNGQGESAFINNKGSGSGGFNFRIVNSDNTKQSGEVSISGNGEIYENGRRVYSPANCPFPVGYVMLMGNGTDPNGLFPGTTWQYLNGTGYDGRAIVLGTDPLAVGGSNTVTLAEAHLPPHRHAGGATGDASTKPDEGAGQWGTGRFGTDAKGGYALMQTSAAGSGQAFSVQNEYVHLLGWMRTA